MFYTVYVNKPHRGLRGRCKVTRDGRFILFEGDGNRHDVMELAREASDQAASVNVVESSARSIGRERLGLPANPFRKLALG